LGEDVARTIAHSKRRFTFDLMNLITNARRLRRKQTPEEKELWQALRAKRLGGFKFRRQHAVGKYFLDFYCPAVKLSVELDGFHHSARERRQHDQEREMFLAAQGIVQLRFWNHQWREDRNAVLLEIWNRLSSPKPLAAPASRGERRAAR
jgi:very-short-patch-repair endonuclease